MATIDRGLLSSPRFLTLQHSQKVKLEKKPASKQPLPPGLESKLAKIDVGQEMLYSHFTPALPGGRLTIDSKQTVKAGAQTLDDDKSTTQQVVNVEAPQYSLPEGIVHSIFPASGSEVPPQTLPHILFTDPYLPWERLAASNADEKSPIPWLALLVFGMDELRLDERVVNGETSIFKNTAAWADAQKAGKPIELTPDFALNLPVADFPKIGSTAVPCITLAPASDTPGATGNAILVRRGVFDLLTTQDVSGGTPPQKPVDVSRYRYLAHVRHSAAEGMEAAGDPEGLFSVIHSHRVGPFEETKSSRAVVHLVSIEGWGDLDRNTTAEYVVLASLHSWSYIVLPANAPNIEASFRNIGMGLNVLRPPDDVLERVKADKSPYSRRIYQRLKDGYTLVRYRTQTGEETAAIARGALVPSIPPYQLSKTWTSLSFCGTDLEIFDREAGLMDLSYAMAWNLGKTLALADANFMTALSRLRSMTETYAANNAKRKELKEKGAYTSNKKTIESLPGAFAMLGQLSRGELGSPDPTSIPGRVEPVKGEAMDISMSNPSVAARFEQYAAKRVQHFAGGSDEEGKGLFNELNTPNSMDWMVVLSWIMDRLYLFGVPTQYLISDPSWLPDESLRFFYIDPHWTDALIDGALSLANHIDPDDDKLRRVFKGALNTYFDTVDPILGYRPQVPTYGFFLRSHLVRDFPDLHVTAPIPGSSDKSNRAPILRQDRLADDTLFCLFDRVPGANELKKISFTQPPHQQTFVVGDRLSTAELELTYRYAYASGHNGTYENNLVERLIRADGSGDKPQLFVWGEGNSARLLNVPVLAGDIDTALKQNSATGFGDRPKDPLPAALVGYQLGCPVFRLDLASELTDLPVDDSPRLLQKLDPQAGTAIPPGPNTAAMPSDGLMGTEPPPVAIVPPVIPPQQPALALTARLFTVPPPMEISAAAAGEDSGAPTFNWLVYPIGAYKSAIPMTGKPQDLVFSIKLASGLKYGYDVEEIRVSIPMGPKKSDMRKNLIAGYTGPGPVMLSNLRFNALMSTSKGWLDITLLPRSTTGRVSVRRLRDCSFILPQAVVITYEKDMYPRIRHTERYNKGPVQGGDNKLVDVHLGPA